MLWPIVLPFQITFCVLMAVVASVTVLSPLAGIKRKTTFIATSAMACVAFVPSCSGIMSFIDARRFGVFQYAAFEDVKDSRIERFLPPAARNITLEKSALGHRARYTIEEPGLQAYVDDLWRKYGQYSAVPRSALGDGTTVTDEAFKHNFAGLDWAPMKTAITFHSPVEDDGGGATYYFDRASGVAYHRAGYW